MVAVIFFFYIFIYTQTDTDRETDTDRGRHRQTERQTDTDTHIRKTEVGPQCNNINTKWRVCTRLKVLTRISSIFWSFVLELCHFCLLPNLVDDLFFIFTFIIIFVAFDLWALAYGGLLYQQWTGQATQQNRSSYLSSVTRAGRKIDVRNCQLYANDSVYNEAWARIIDAYDHKNCKEWPSTSIRLHLKE
jgi:hypothetical protein